MYQSKAFIGRNRKKRNSCRWSWVVESLWNPEFFEFIFQITLEILHDLYSQGNHRGKVKLR